MEGDLAGAFCVFSAAGRACRDLLWDLGLFEKGRHGDWAGDCRCNVFSAVDCELVKRSGIFEICDAFLVCGRNQDRVGKRAGWNAGRAGDAVWAGRGSGGLCKIWRKGHPVIGK